MGAKHGTPEERFWRRVKKTKTCWLWQGALNDGYGHIKIKSEKRESVHRFSYELFNGKIPTNLVIDHLCRVTSCVNPAHLEAVSMIENIMRGYGPPADNKRKTHCINGHPFNGNNLIKWDKYRQCRQCNRKKNLDYYYRKKKNHKLVDSK